MDAQQYHAVATGQLYQDYSESSPTNQYSQFGQGHPQQGPPVSTGRNYPCDQVHYPPQEHASPNYNSVMNTSPPANEKVNTSLILKHPSQPEPSAPCQMETVDGYDNVGVSGICPPPPSCEEVSKPLLPAPEREDIKCDDSVVVLGEEEAREALLGYVAEHCCYGKGAAQNMRFTQLVPSNAFHYTLESFCESRSTAWAFVPYVGQFLDTPINGSHPSPWEIPAIPGPDMFQDSQVDLEVPHTASVKSCHNCSASGWIRCDDCEGRGKVKCTSCNGSGRRSNKQRCHTCNGKGTESCDRCNGRGKVTCTLCEGRTQVKCSMKLTIKWVNHVNDHIVGRTEFQNDLIRNVSGQQVFQETAQRVFPLNHFPNQEINNVSNTLVTSHSGAFKSERMMMQRHTVRIVPVTKVTYDWKERKSDFFVYGFENKVYAPKYPQKCCCGCTLL